MSARISFLLFVILLIFSPLSVSAGDTGENTYRIKFLTYNICGLPDMLTGPRDVIPAEKRLPFLGKKFGQYDIIGLQEMFIPERFILEKKLSSFFLARGTDTQDMKTPGSGIYIFSRWNFSKFFFEKWVDSREYDSISQKGFVGATVLVDDILSFDIYNLHAQAQDNADVRRSQFEQLLEGISGFSGGSGRPVVVMGDFNCEPGEEECDWFLSESGLATTAVDDSRVDMVLFKENSSGWNVGADGYRVILEEKINGKRLSDHEGVEVVLTFTEK